MCLDRNLFRCQRIVIVFLMKIYRVLQVDLENVSLHIFIHLCENIKVINFSLVQKSKFARWKWFAHGISVKIVTIKAHMLSIHMHEIAKELDINTHNRNNIEKLIPNFYPKKNYVLHYRNLKF